MMMTFGKSIYYDFCVFNSWSYIFIFLMVCCTSVSQVTHLRFDSSTFFCPCSALSVSQFHSITQPCLTLCNPMDCSMPSFPVLHHLLELAQAHIHWVGETIQSSDSLLSPSPPAFNLSQLQGLFQWVSSSHHVTKYWSFSFSISSSNECSGLIFFRIDMFDLLPVQGTLKSLFQLHSSKASILWPSAFFMVQLSHPYTTQRAAGSI